MSPTRKTTRRAPRAAKAAPSIAAAPLTPASDWNANGTVVPLGASWIPEVSAWNFALYAYHATAVTLLVYADDLITPAAELPLEWRANRTGRIWHRRVRSDEIPGARYYAYRVDGPVGGGNLFDSSKALLDPYAPAVFFPPGFDRMAAIRPGSNAGCAPLGVLSAVSATFDWGSDRAPRHGGDLVIYELHVRQFTERANSGVSDDVRGTFAGLVAKIPYLVDLGVTAVELMPIFQCDPQEGSDWGYMPLHFFAPQQSYASGGDPTAAFDEFRTMVKALHAAGIEVILDVVYNHTTEEGFGGPTYAFRGLDNGTYYLLDPVTWAYRDDTGVGNVLRTAHPQVRAMVLDSMRFWVREGHVDGFRFDLASIFTLRNDGTPALDEPSLIAEMTSDPTFADVRLIAEPWDPATYQLGRSFPGIVWSQWNGRYRDDVRSFVRSDPGMVGSLMTRLYGSDDLFPDQPPDAYRPWQSINFITCHDGFTLYDLVAYNQKHNEANGENNTDGTDDNLSWNCGVEGDTNVPDNVRALRVRQAKNFFTLLFVANGTPMFRAGDEFLQTQQGNNNPYNQDNETTWLDWDRLVSYGEVHRFARGLIAFRKSNPAFARNQFWHDDVRWYGVGASPDLSWDSHSIALCVHGASVGGRDVYVMINAYWEPLTFTVQEGAPDAWQRIVDTSLASPDDLLTADEAPVLTSGDYVVGPRSIVVLQRQ